MSRVLATEVRPDIPKRPAGSRPGDVSQLLVAWRHGSDDALERLTPLVYGELRRLAQHYVNGERRHDVPQATALVHEAFLRLVDLEMDWQDRRHFFAMAGRLMRRVLVDCARKRNAEKRGAGAPPKTLVGLESSLPAPVDILGLDLALQALERLDPRKTRVVELRCFAGLTIDETAEELGVSPATVERDLKMARAWLVKELGLADEP